MPIYKSKYEKSIHCYFGLSDERGEVFINAVVKAWSNNLQDKKMLSINAVKHKTFMDVFIDLRATPQECCLIGMMIEQAYSATREKPKTGFFGNIK